jgi:hypothetical protein
LNEEELDGPMDANGWTVKDHIVHMAAWERSIVFMLQKKPRYAGLKVDEALYERSTDDEINAEIFRQTHSLHVDEALAELRYNHQEMLRLLDPLTDADLERSYQHYLPDERYEGDGPPAYDLIYGNTAGHYRQHLEWMRKLVG